jgi:Papain-like cysteine protease AvrRpt2
MACWFASTMMLLNWRERHRPLSGLVSPGIDAQTLAVYRANTGLANAQIIPLATRMGLTPIPPQTPTMEALRNWLATYGPLWTNGTAHIVVIAGIKQTAKHHYLLKVYDPWPGTPVQWRDFRGWYEGASKKQRDNATRDVGLDVNAVFLHI